MEHVAIIAAQMRRLDEVVQGFLRFIRPGGSEARAGVRSPALVDAIVPIVSAEAERHGIELRDRDPGRPAGRPRRPGHDAAGAAEPGAQRLPGDAPRRPAAVCRRRPRAASASRSSCEDTGAGIPPEHLDKIFDLYFTTKESGSGIGLSMVYRAVQLHDGEIEVQSTPGRGTTFRVLLPQASSSGS